RRRLLPRRARDDLAAHGAVRGHQGRRPGRRRDGLLRPEVDHRPVTVMGEFDGKVVLITGCARARGMGRALSVAFARAGADVVATDVAAAGTRNENEEGLEEIRLGWKGLESLAGEIEGLGRRALAVVGDVSRAA